MEAGEPGPQNEVCIKAAIDRVHVSDSLPPKAINIDLVDLFMPLDLHQFSIHPSLVSVLAPNTRVMLVLGEISLAFALKQYVELAVGAALWVQESGNTTM